jgi:nitroimidazol reductase NimA-like FMN-containing flavoprotein (pyridoxamine 5'-phosphate oxidase superfamily)
MTKKATPPSPRTQIRRVRERGHYDRETIESIAQEALICHIAFADEQGVHCIPTACWVSHGYLYIHGSNGSRMIQALMAGEASVTITHLDGIVLARSAFHHSMNYRSVVAYGKFEKVESESEKMESFEAFIEFLSPGRWPQVRQPSRNELAATTVLRLSLTEAAAKVRNWSVKDDEADMQQAVWAGVIPLSMEAGKPEPDTGGSTCLLHDSHSC